MSTSVTEELLQVHRLPDRGSRDRAVIDAILDAGMLCHLGTIRDGRPVVLPTLYGRDGDRLIVHGSAAARSLRAGAAGLPVCVTVTLIDGLVLARSGFHHSANYRSVVVHGEAQLLTDPAAKAAALEVLTEHVAPGRWAQLRPPTDGELKATTVLSVPLDHAVAKVRDGGVHDDATDLGAPVWAGVVPLSTHLGEPQPDPHLAPDLTPPTWWDRAGGPARPATSSPEEVGP